MGCRSGRDPRLGRSAPDGGGRVEAGRASAGWLVREWSVASGEWLGMINSTRLMQILVGEYVLLALVCLAEGNYPRLLYWASAAGITTAVLWGTR